MIMGFAARLAERPAAPRAQMVSRAPVVLVSNLHDVSGRLAWYFVRVASPKYAAFRRQLAQGSIDLAQYGEILASGFGSHPPAYVRSRMIVIYGFREE